uniref:Uncharacterized protein n=1 Tax=Phenylobacterium glaciei TaxID=2803784 RepID=A0A974S6V6_9CAUL|nr:hypothetical protein JKL49_14510 [Phenylobacterium glaciei]
MDVLARQLLISTAVVSATVLIHLLGLDALQGLLRWHLERFTRWINLDRVLVPLGVVLGLFVLHGLEIWLYALVYWKMQMLPTLEQALYFPPVPIRRLVRPARSCPTVGGSLGFWRPSTACC